MKTRFLFLAFFITVASSWYALAATDYGRLKKDVSVMSEILKSAFKADSDCRGCSVRVDGMYLAEQGVVFTIASSGSNRYAWAVGDDGDHHFNFSFENSEFEGLEDLPEMVEEIVAGVMPVIPSMPEVSSVIRIVDDSTREALREIRRDRRELQQELRESEIEMIHVEEEQRRELEKEITKLERQRQQLDDKQQQIEDKMNITRQELLKEREGRRMQKQARLQEQQKLVQNKVLDAFCDYGSTLRSVPGKEKITIVFKNTSLDPNQDTVMVLDQDEVIACDRGKNSLRNQATSYQF